MKHSKEWHLLTPALRALGRAIAHPEGPKMDPYNCRVRETLEQMRRAEYERLNPELARLTREINSRMAAMGLR